MSLLLGIAVTGRMTAIGDSQLDLLAADCLSLLPVVQGRVVTLAPERGSCAIKGSRQQGTTAPTGIATPHARV